jgi:hypothetical protein
MVEFLDGIGVLVGRGFRPGIRARPGIYSRAEQFACITLSSSDRFDHLDALRRFDPLQLFADGQQTFS